MKDRAHDEAMAEMFRDDPGYTIQLLNSIHEEGDQSELLITLRQMTFGAQWQNQHQARGTNRTVGSLTKHSTTLPKNSARTIMHRKYNALELLMKTATFPSLRVDPELRLAAEAVLEDGETLSSFMEQSLRALIDRRCTHQAFLERGLASRDEAARTGEYYAADDVLRELDEKLLNAEAKVVP